MANDPVLDSWIHLVESEFALEISELRKGRFAQAMSRFASKLEIDLAQLYKLAIQQELSAVDWSHILHIATNHETSFFRHEGSINFIVEKALSMAETKVLSIGCSSGQEAYSIGIALRSANVTNMKIHGTDVSPKCIELSRAGVYSSHPRITSKVASLSMDNSIAFREDFKSHFTFQVHNILTEAPIHFDVPDFIITQNVLIYYKQPRKHQILDRLAMMLPIGGHLIVGAAEDNNWRNPTMEHVKAKHVNAFVKKTSEHQ